MARYVDIECDAVKEALLRCAFKTRQDIQDFLDDIPTADVTPVRHGRWEHNQRYVSAKYVICSECKYSATFKRHKMPLFCPNCWAKMDRGTNNA